MVDFVLVHGSGQNAGSWSRVGELLGRRGHRVATPELAKHSTESWLEDHAALIADHVRGPNTIVVAHSLSGVFLPIVAQQTGCSLLVFVAAVIPIPGRSVREQFTEDPSMFCPGWIEAGAAWFDESKRDELAREFLFHDCDAETLGWALRTVDPLDSRTLVTQPNPCPAWPSVATAAIVAAHDRTLSADWCRRASREILRVDAIEMPTGHCPHVSQPTATADVLEVLAIRACG